MIQTDNLDPRVDRKALSRALDRLDIPADLKVLLSAFLDKTIEIGGRVVQVGARIIAFVFDLAKAYPGIAFGVIVALVLAYLIHSIPVVGPVVSPVLTPVMLIIGLSYGALNDLTNSEMRVRLNLFSEQMRAAGIP